MNTPKQPRLYTSGLLRQFSDDALLAELVRRRNTRAAARPVLHWCDRCDNFQSWFGNGDPPDDYNPCAKGHEMQFRMPENEATDEWGYYRRVCADRAEADEEAAEPAQEEDE